MCGVSPKVSASVARLMDEGNAIPFIARYRKGVTEGMTPDQLRDFRDHYDLLKYASAELWFYVVPTEAT